MVREYVAIVPARSGSRGIKDKNLLKISTLNLIERAVDEANTVDKIKTIIVSSDSISYLNKVNVQTNKLVKSLRDPSAAEHNSPASAVLMDVIWRHNLSQDTLVIYLQPTSPLRTRRHIESAIEIFEQSTEKSLVSVVESSQHPQKALQLNGSKLRAYFPGAQPTANRQELPESVHPNGAIYIFAVVDFLEEGDIPIIGASSFKMSKRDSLDIDQMIDFEFAKYLVDNEKF